MSKKKSSFSITISASELLNELRANCLITSDDDSISHFILQRQQHKKLPFYLNILIGLGAFIASICFIGVIVIGFSIKSEESFIAFGLVFCVLAILLQKVVENSNGGLVKVSFFSQSLFSFMVSGKVLFSFGMASVFDFSWGLSVTLLIVTLTTYPLYRVSIDRFLSCSAFFVSLLVNVLWQRDFVGLRELLFNSLMLFYMISIVVLIINAKIKYDYIPILYSLLFSLCVSVLFLASHSKFGYWRNEEVVSELFTTWLFSGSLILAIGWIVNDVKKMKTEPLILACIGAFLLGFISAPGIVLAITLMVVGYAKHEKTMLTMGVFLVPIFLILYYYNLDISLMEKSMVLVGSGVALLVGRFYIGFKGWNRDVTR